MITWNQNMQHYMTWIQTSLKSYKRPEDIYVDIAKDVETIFSISNYQLER